MTAVADPPLAAPPPPPRRRRRWLRLLLLLALVAVTATVFAGRFGGPQPVRSVLLGGRAPALAGPTLSGGMFDLAQYRGSVVLVNVWASWCVPCQREQPLLVEAYRQLAPQGLSMVGINVRDDPASARDFLSRFGNAPWPSVLDPDGRKAIDWGTFALPETYLVDRSGTVVAKAVGQLDATWIRTNVAPLLAAR